MLPAPDKSLLVLFFKKDCFLLTAAQTAPPVTGLLARDHERITVQRDLLRVRDLQVRQIGLVVGHAQHHQRAGADRAQIKRFAEAAADHGWPPWQ